MTASKSDLLSTLQTFPLLWSSLAALRTERFREHIGGDAVTQYDWEMERKTAQCRDDISIRLLRVRHAPVDTLTWHDLANLLGCANANTLRGWVRGSNLPSRGVFELVDAALTELEEYLILPSMPQMNPWSRNSDT